MPRTPTLSIAFPSKQNLEGGIGSPRSPSDSGIDDFYKQHQLQETQSPASPRASRSFFSSYRAGKQNRIRAQEPAPSRAPSAPNSVLSTPITSQPTYRLSPDTSSANLSYGNLLDTLSLSDGSMQEVAPTSELGSTETESAPRAETDIQSQRRPSKHVFHNILNRSRSVRTDTTPKPPAKPSTKGRFLEPIPRDEDLQTSPRTAPLDPDRGYRDAMVATNRNRSADRTPNSKATDAAKPGSFNENTNMMANIRSTSSSAATGIGKASKGFFSKLARTGSNNDKEVHLENYDFQVITLPLVEQTRRTRIRKRMEDARDKTEFWMPALPYRCIDYLNLKGVEEEGLYRIPGSGREIKQWQARFDTELDVNLLDEHELYDINIVGSMLKAWLRQIPDELFPRETQARIQQACQGMKETPQMMKDELSKLPPYNYYLLFAITCHIALLHSHSDKNKMNFHNLCICFQPSMGIEGFCFYFLVCDWRNCWQGCWTEKEYLASEQQLPGNSTVPPTSSAGQSMAQLSIQDNDAFSSTSGSRPPTGGQGSSVGATEKRRPSPIATQGEDEWDKLKANKPATIVSSPSTPPSLSPVAQVSPMRL